MELKPHIRKIGAYLLLWVSTGVALALLFWQIDRSYNETRRLLEKNLLGEAIAHFDSLVVAREWNASYGGLFVRSRDLEPNPYLRDNLLRSDANETLVRINPAWMTRQISELSNRHANYYYKITSLQPINPKNEADDFEMEALEYFERHKEQKYYYRIDDSFDFMGALVVERACLACHAEQGYKEGDVRGGIRVSLPLDNYKAAIELAVSQKRFGMIAALAFALLVGLISTLYLRFLFRYEKHVEELSGELEERVQERTQELEELNKKLETRVAQEVQKSRVKDEAMMMQSRYVAMGEMMRMVAHQWRQPIAEIDMQISSIILDYELGELQNETLAKELRTVSLQIQKLS